MIKKNEVVRVALDSDPPPEQPAAAPYQLDWSGVLKAPPTWFADAKFGILFHWGPYCVPEFDSEWYSRNMYTVGSRAHAHHVKAYGPISRFGYKNLYNAFTGENFDPDAWLSLFQRAGAKYVIACAEHADGYALWDSRVNPVNSLRYGLGYDMLGAVKAAAGRAGMKFGASLHHSWNFGWFCSTDPQADVYDPKNQAFYGAPVPYSASYYYPSFILPDDAFQQNWLAKMKEVVDQYLPDYIYLDGRVYIIAEKYRLAFARHYQEAAQRAGKEALISFKAEDFHRGAGILDFERHWMPGMRPDIWQGDDTVQWKTWSYVADGEYRHAGICIAQLVDTVSKNGNYVLNVGPRKDGTFDAATASILREVGDWLSVNGEAIYGSKPFSVFGEGPTLQPERVTLPEHFVPFTPEDIRFTQKDGAVYAIPMAWPASGVLRIKSLGRGGALERAVRKVSILGGGALSFAQDGAGLSVRLPEAMPCKHLGTLKIEC